MVLCVMVPIPDDAKGCLENPIREVYRDAMTPAQHCRRAHFKHVANAQSIDA
jgi:hypothetical protein